MMRLTFNTEAKLVYGTSVSLIDFLGREPLMVYHPEPYWWVLFGIGDMAQPTPEPPSYGMDILPSDDGGYGMLMEYGADMELPAPIVGGFGYWAGMGKGGFRWVLQPCPVYRPYRQHRWVRLYPAHLLDKIDEMVADASPSITFQLEVL